MQWPKLSRRAWLGTVFGSLPVVTLSDAAVLEPSRLQIRRLPLGGNSPAVRFVHFTDLHHKGSRSYLDTLVRKINQLEPEFVCFSGDLVEKRQFLPEALEGLREIKAPLYGVPGNHDYRFPMVFDEVGKVFAATGGAWLVDQTTLASDGRVQLAGASCRRTFALSPKPGIRNVALIHYPVWIHRLEGRRFDLVLAGHSHGGQVRLPFIGALLVPPSVGRYDLGLFQTAAGPLYVGAGIGWIYLKVRFRCRPEITLIEL